jgi:hypothetical protein
LTIFLAWRVALSPSLPAKHWRDQSALQNWSGHHRDTKRAESYALPFSSAQTLLPSESLQLSGRPREPLVLHGTRGPILHSLDSPCLRMARW